MKKHYSKRKRVVIDAIDGTIINEPIAIKISNVEEYIEKNGFKTLNMRKMHGFTYFISQNVGMPL